MRASSSFPVLSGHVGGANAMSERIADLLGATPVLTTASDVGKTIPVDILGRHLGWQVQAPRSTSPACRPMWSMAAHCPGARGGQHPLVDRPTPLPANVECLTAFAQVRPDHHKAVLCGSPMLMCPTPSGPTGPSAWWCTARPWARLKTPPRPEPCLR